MAQLCLIFNLAPQYREEIYKLIDREYSCHWYFGENKTDIKGLNLSILKDVSLLPTWRIPHTPFYYQRGAVNLLWRKEYTTYFMLGELYCLSTWLFLLCRKVFRPHKKIYFWTHGWYGKETLIRRIIKRIFFKQVDGIFLYGNHARELMLQEGFDGSRLFVIHNSLDYDKQLTIRRQLSPSDVYKKHFDNDAPNLIFIGRLTAVKRLDELIKALALLKQHGRACNLTLVGDGEMRQQLEAMSKEEHVSEYIWFYGACYDENANAKLIYNADLCISPGNVGLTAIHAMTFGCPVITHNDFAHQMPEYEAIHEGSTGTFFKRDNVASLAEAVNHWLSCHHNDRETVRQACYNEIDSQWTPEWQLEVIRKNLRL